MQRVLCILLLLLVAVPAALGRSWHLEPSTVSAAGEFLIKDFTGLTPTARFPVDRDHVADGYAVGFEVPAAMPSFLMVTTQATRRGRLTIHLQPAGLPETLAAAAPDDDWANPYRLYDFRTVVEIAAGAWQEHVLSLNRDFFEAVTRMKRPFDLAGLRFSRVAFSLSVPAEEGQVLTIHRIRGLGLNGAAASDFLEHQILDLSDRLRQLDKDSPVRRYWAPVVERADRRVRHLDLENPDTKDWWLIQDELAQLQLKSRNWQRGSGLAKNYWVGTASSLVRISGRHDAFANLDGLPSEVRIESARNEFESFQMVIATSGRGLDGVRLRPSDLRAVQGTARIGAHNVHLYEQVEQFIQPSPGTAQSQVGWLPDALLPLELPMSLSAGETKPIWVTVKTPLETIPGRYVGEIRVIPEEGGQTRVPIELIVHDFAMPVTGRFRTQGHFDLQGLVDWYGEKDKDRIRKRFYRLLVEHRFSPTSQYSPILSPERDDIPWIMEAGGTVILTGGFSGEPLDPAIIDPAYQWLVEHRLVNRAIIYIGDETDDFRGVRAKASTIRKRWPQLRIMVGGSKPREELIGYVDVWDPITFGGATYNFEPESVRQAVNRDEEVFWYTCVGPRAPFANIYNDHPLTAVRALWWQAWKYGVTGFEYWWFNWWRPNLSLSKGPRPWPVGNRTDWNSRAYDWANGDGLLVYPGPGGTPLASLRLSVVRDAIEDWEALFLLERAVEKVVAQPGQESSPLVREARELLRVPAEITSDLSHWSDAPEIYLKHRHEVYRLLAALRAAIGGTEFERLVLDWEQQRQSRMQRSFETRVEKSTELK